MITIDVDELRDRFVIQELKSIQTGAVLLDAGAGQQKYRKYCDHLRYISQDFNEYNGGGDGKGLQKGVWDVTKTEVISDITEIPLADDSIDVILCTEVFEHIPDPIAAVKEFNRLLHSGGKLILTAPFCSMTHFSPYHFSTGFNRYWYEKVLCDNGFKIEKMERGGNYFKWLGQEAIRIDEIIAKYCGARLNVLDKIVRRYVLKRLSDFSNKDGDSGDILCYEYYVVAEKL